LQKNYLFVGDMALVFEKKILKALNYSYMSTVTLLLGGNQGDTQKILAQALGFIELRVGEIINCTSMYKSPPWGFEDSQWFLNQVVVVETSFDAHEVLENTQTIEKEMGRKKKTTTHYEARPLDIDILFFDNLIISLPDLFIPHPRLHQRRFTLVPLVEVAPEKVHPQMNKRIRVLLEECSDKSEVVKLL
jgi:2-amino-4-hydroxy-6-hydroxymethyldihydropteridine diphosphokinase